VATVLDALAPWLAAADGVTVSGGEPFEQPAALERLLRDLRQHLGTERDILVYSGFAWETIAPKVALWEGLADALISDPFRAAAGQTLVWRGSDNQRMHLLTALGHARYAAWVAAPRAALPQALDVFFQAGEVWLAGIPAAGTLDALQTQLKEAGFTAATSQAPGANGNPIFA
jgi:anaerobic ribonucleoside-triphosphate reductase activating protein